MAVSGSVWFWLSRAFLRAGAGRDNVWPRRLAAGDGSGRRIRRGLVAVGPVRGASTDRLPAGCPGRSPTGPAVSAPAPRRLADRGATSASAGRR